MLLCAEKEIFYRNQKIASFFSESLGSWKKRLRTPYFTNNLGPLFDELCTSIKLACLFFLLHIGHLRQGINLSTKNEKSAIRFFHRFTLKMIFHALFMYIRTFKTTMDTRV